jgi:hypothetical protein
MYDKNEESHSPARIGLALASVSFDEIIREGILSNYNHLTSADHELIIDFNMVPIIL